MHNVYLVIAVLLVFFATICIYELRLDRAAEKYADLAGLTTELLDILDRIEGVLAPDSVFGPQQLHDVDVDLDSDPYIARLLELSEGTADVVALDGYRR